MAADTLPPSGKGVEGRAFSRYGAATVVMETLLVVSGFNMDRGTELTFVRVNIDIKESDMALGSVPGKVDCSNAEGGHCVFKSFIISIFFVSSLYVLTTLICRPEDPNQLSELSAALSPLPHFCLLQMYIKDKFRSYLYYHKEC